MRGAGDGLPAAPSSRVERPSSDSRTEGRACLWVRGCLQGVLGGLVGEGGEARPGEDLGSEKAGMIFFVLMLMRKRRAPGPSRAGKGP